MNHPIQRTDESMLVRPQPAATTAQPEKQDTRSWDELNDAVNSPGGSGAKGAEAIAEMGRRMGLSSMTAQPTAQGGTPRTDAMTVSVLVDCGHTVTVNPTKPGTGRYVEADFCRTLERELAEARAERDASRLKYDEEKQVWQHHLDEVVSEKREAVELRRLLDDRNGLLHQLRSMLRESGFADRIKFGEDLHGNEDWVPVRIECQLRDALSQLTAAQGVIAKWKDCAEYGWTIIANAGGGDWTRESEDWQKAAMKFRDENYYPCIALTPETYADRLREAEAEAAQAKLDCGQLHGRIGLFAKKWWFINDNLPTDETFAQIEQQVATAANDYLVLQGDRDALRAELAELRALLDKLDAGKSANVFEFCGERYVGVEETAYADLRARLAAKENN